MQSLLKELSFFFSTEPSTLTPRAVANFERSTCCIVKPHAVKAGMAGRIIAEIQTAGFDITGLQTFNLKYENAEEFYEIYKGVVQDYTVSLIKQYSRSESVYLALMDSCIKLARAFSILLSHE